MQIWQYGIIFAKIVKIYKFMKGYIPRLLESAVRQSIKEYPVQIVTGPRQSGKTTMCRHLMPDYKFVNLERLTNRRYAQDDPAAFLKSLGPKAIIDEVQNVPELLSEIQASVDEDPDLSYILTGSCNFALMNRVSQSLAGRRFLRCFLYHCMKSPVIAMKCQRIR